MPRGEKSESDLKKAIKQELFFDETKEYQEQPLVKFFEETAYKVSKFKNYIFRDKIEKIKMCDELKIQVFDGSDYNIWKKRILLLLQLKKCHEAATREKVAADDATTWDEKNLKAMNYLYSGISNEQLEFVSDEVTAFAILKKFDSMYLKESTALQICVRNRLEKIKLKDYEDSSSFFTDFEKLINELKSSGASVNEKEKLNYMLRTLPDSLSYIGDLIDAVKESDQTCEFLKNKIMMWELREKGENSKNHSKSSVFKVERSHKGNTFFESEKSEQNKFNGNNTCPRGYVRRGGYYRGTGYSNTQWQGGGHQSSQNYYNQQHNTGSSRGRSGRNFGRRGFRGRRYNGYQATRGNSWQQRSDGERQLDVNNSVRSESHVGSFYSEIQVRSENCMYVESNEGNNIKIEWLLDSGCTDHIINNINYFSEYVDLQKPVDVKVADGRYLKATKVGNIKCYFIVQNEKKKIIIQNVYFVDKIDRNLISFGKITNKNKVISVRNTSVIYNERDQIIAIAEKVNSLYKMTSYIDKVETNMSVKKQKMTLKEKFHRMLGHVNFNYLENMCKNNLVDGIPKELESDYFKCGTCIQNKMHNLPFDNNRTKVKDVLEIVHTDLNGPPPTLGYNGEKYFLSFIDEYSKAARVYTIKSKTEVYECFVDYINSVELLTGKKIKKLRCDRGKEYLNAIMYNLAREKGFVIDPCPPYVHQLNGTAERYNRSVMNTARCLLSEAKVHERFWPEVVRTASYLKNRTLANTKENKTPYEILTGVKPDIKNLRLYGSKVFVRVPEEKRKSKWDRKADLGILLGYENVGYRVLINNKVIVARHVDIIEEDTNVIGFKIDNEVESERNLNSKTIDIENENLENKNFESDMNNENDISDKNVSSKNQDFEQRKSTRAKNKPERFGESITYSCIYVNFINANCPTSYKEAIESYESDEWVQAMDKEIICLKKNETFNLVERPKDKKVLNMKWVYTIKSNKIKKARIVVLGYQQIEILDDLYSPVAKMQTLKILLSFCCQYGYIIVQMDFEAAYLNGDIKSEIYVEQPEGYEDGTDRVCKLNKALYGLRESPRVWYECLDNFLKSLGFRKSENDYCLYILDDKDETIYLINFVDDVLICGKNIKKIDNIKNCLSKRFKMKDLGIVTTYLGVNINYNSNEYVMTLDQKHYIESLACKYNVENAKLYHTPMEHNLQLEPGKEMYNDSIKYRNLIGALLYISTATRLDVSYSVNYLSRFQNSYNETHFKYALRILKYLYETRNLKLTFKRCDTKDIVDCFVDADWAGDSIDRKSTTGYVIRLFGNTVYWKSKKQGSVTKSSTAAEYVALSESVSELKVVINLLKDFKVKVNKPINVYEDNSGAVAIAKYGNFTKNSKYIEVHYHFVHEAYKDKIIDIVKINSENNVADILTKSLGRNKFEKFRTLLNLL